MARELQSPEVDPTSVQKIERLSLDVINRVGGLHNYPHGYMVDDDSKAVIKINRSPAISRTEYASDEEYQRSLARNESLIEVLRFGFTFTESFLLTAEYGAINMLVECGQERGFDKDQIAGVESLKGLFRGKLRDSMQQEAAAITEMIKAAETELWVVAYRGNAENYVEDPRIARYVGVTVTEIDKELKFEPVILSSDEKNRGLFPIDYAPLVDPFYIVADRQS